MSTDPTLPQMPIPVPQRSTYVPAWAPSWSSEDMEKPVFHENEPMGFCLKDVLAERRWALEKGPEGAIQTRPQIRFEADYKRWIPYGYNPGKNAVEALAMVHPDLEPIPRVERFINYTIDEHGGHAIGWHPHPETLPPEPTEEQQLSEREAREEIIKEASKQANVEPVPEDDYEQAACGDEVRRGYAKQHSRWCKKCQAMKKAEAKKKESD